MSSSTENGQLQAMAARIESLEKELDAVKKINRELYTENEDLRGTEQACYEAGILDANAYFEMGIKAVVK